MDDDYGYFCDPDTIDTEPIIIHPHVIHPHVRIDDEIIPQKHINNNRFSYENMYKYNKSNIFIKITQFVYNSVPDICHMIYTTSFTKLYNRFRGFRL